MRTIHSNTPTAGKNAEDILTLLAFLTDCRGVLDVTRTRYGEPATLLKLVTAGTAADGRRVSTLQIETIPANRTDDILRDPIGHADSLGFTHILDLPLSLEILPVADFKRLHDEAESVPDAQFETIQVYTLEGQVRLGEVSVDRLNAVDPAGEFSARYVWWGEPDLDDGSVLVGAFIRRVDSDDPNAPWVPVYEI